MAKALSSLERRLFELRLERGRKDLLEPLRRLYGWRPDHTAFEADLLAMLARGAAERPADLRELDLKRDLNPDWFLEQSMLGYVFYLDRFNGDLKGVLEKIDYLKELGVTYVHFMPCLKPREGDSDGGYSVMDYRQIDPRFGTMADFEAVARALRAEGISVCLDLVLNHTAKEHDWAQKARAGDPMYQEYYYCFDSDHEPKRYERTLVEIFPDTAPGSFTYYPDMKKWVWTTFNEHQWDLNWSNPKVFLEILDTIIFLANKGADVFRLDAVAFMWKRMGTTCQNLPEVHELLQALKAAMRIVAPATLHKAEAIVAPRDLVPYLGAGRHAGKESNLAYHNNLMVQFWSSLASRDARLMTHVLRTHFPGSFRNATWGAYLRCHDDIGWAVTDEDAAALGVSAPAHRGYLADFYEGVFPGSWARGGLFQYNPLTGDKRNNGSCASLCGLEAALEAGDAQGADQAIQRMLMGHALIAAFGGIPLIYMGDELGLLNDHSYLADPSKRHDSRWMHRPAMDWAKAGRRHDLGLPEGQIFTGLKHILDRRRATAHLHGLNATTILDSPDPAVFAMRRESPLGALVGLFNFTPDWRHIPRGWIEAMGAARLHDELSEATVSTPNGTLDLPPYGRVWLT